MKVKSSTMQFSTVADDIIWTVAFLLATIDISACFITFQSAIFNSVFYLFIYLFLFQPCATRSPRQQQTFSSFACRMLCRTLCSPVCRRAPTLSDRRKCAPSCEKPQRSSVSPHPGATLVLVAHAVKDNAVVSVTLWGTKV